MADGVTQRPVKRHQVVRSAETARGGQRSVGRPATETAGAAVPGQRDPQPRLRTNVDDHASDGITVAGFALGSGWALAPLRLFLGVTFTYAGLQKLTDPGFFRPGARDYIGTQITAFAHGSPISGPLLHIALPHAAIFGGLIAWGEIAIGLGVLAGLFARPAAFFGLLLSVTFFLSATWHVFPYFYGSDIVFVFAWIALLLAPHAGLPAAEDAIAARLRVAGLAASPRRSLLLTFVLAAPPRVQVEQIAPERPAAAGRAGAGVTVRGSAVRGGPRRGGRNATARQRSRRGFLLGVGAGALGALGLTWLWSATHPAASPPAPASGGASGAGTEAATGTTAAGSPSVIARASDVPANSAATFTLANGDPGVLVHLADGRFVGFDATCTHAGCPVQYDPGAKVLYCPCHGAAFDPAKQAAVLQGPASVPLLPVAVTVATNGDITTSD